MVEGCVLIHGHDRFLWRWPLAPVTKYVEPFIKENALHFNDEAIEIDPRNSQKIADAVSQLRRDLPPKEKPVPTVLDRLAALEKQCHAVEAEFRSIAVLNCKGKERNLLEITLNCASAALQQIEQDHNLYPNEATN